MEPDLDGLLATAADALDKRDRDKVLASLAGMIVQKGHTGRLAIGERDVVFLLPDRLVFVQPDLSLRWSYKKSQVVRILFAAGHIQFEFADDDIEFWIDPFYSAAEPFLDEAEAWLAAGTAPSRGGIVMGLIFLVAVLGLAVTFGTADQRPAGRLTGGSTCSEFLWSSVDQQLDVLRHLFVQAGRPGDAENPSVLAQSSQRCSQNGTATLDTVVSSR